VIDTIIAEMDHRFSDLNLSHLNAMQALLPDSDHFLDLNTLAPLIHHYNIDTEEVCAEIATAKSFLKDSPPTSHLDGVYMTLKTAEESFPALPKCLQIALTIGVTSASAERSFSALRRLKTYLRSTITQERVTYLSVIYVEREISHELWNPSVQEELILQFAEQHESNK
jgi:hypothetical protein